MKGEKERARRRKGGEEKKAIVALLVFVTATVEKKTVGRQNPISFKSPARYIDEFLKTLPPNRSFPLGSFFLRSKMSPE